MVLEVGFSYACVIASFNFSRVPKSLCSKCGTDHIMLPVNTPLKVKCR